MWSILVCDLDDGVTNKIKQKTIQTYAEKIKHFKSFRNEVSLLFYIEDHKSEDHVVFIDVELNQGNGVALAAKLKKLKRNTVIIFMTGKQSYIPEIYDVEHVYLLKKPSSYKLLSNALKKAEAKIEEHSTAYITAVTKADVVMIPLREIVFIEKEKRKVHIIDIKGGKISYYSSFHEIQEQLNSDFYRCHNSYIINLRKVISIDSKSALMEGGKTISVSRTHSKELRNLVLGLNLAERII